MTVNELIVQLDLLPAEAEVIIRMIGGDSDEVLAGVSLLPSGEVLLECPATVSD